MRGLLVNAEGAQRGERGIVEALARPILGEDEVEQLGVGLVAVVGLRLGLRGRGRGDDGAGGGRAVERLECGGHERHVAAFDGIELVVGAQFVERAAAAQIALALLDLQLSVLAPRVVVGDE